MKSTLLWISLGLLIFPGMPAAEADEHSKLDCQKLAHDFSEDPEALNAMQLNQLQFCITQTIEQRYATDPPDLLKGTIIDSPPASNEDAGTAPEAPSPNSNAK